MWLVEHESHVCSLVCVHTWCLRRLEVLGQEFSDIFPDFVYLHSFSLFTQVLLIAMALLIHFSCFEDVFPWFLSIGSCSP